MSEMLSQPEVRSARECDCPPWTMRCTHWADKCLVLTSLAAAAAGHQCHKRTYGGSLGWYDLTLLEGEYTPCYECGVGGFMFSSRYTSEDRGMATEHEALAAFYAAEERLLRGEA